MLALITAGGLVLAGGAGAQPGGMGAPGTIMGYQPTDPALHGGAGQWAGSLSQHDRYVIQLKELRKRTIKAKAQDGGELTPEHKADLQHQLDELNRRYGVRAD
jgi:hypothetical protein